MSSVLDDLARAATDEEEYLTVEAFAKLFTISTGTVYKWMSRGKVHSIKLGYRIVRIPRSEVVRLAEENYRKAVDG